MSKIQIFILWCLLPFPFLPFPLTGGTQRDFQAHKPVPALNMGRHIPIPRCRLICAKGSLSAGSVSRSSRQRAACLQPLSNPQISQLWQAPRGSEQCAEKGKTRTLLGGIGMLESKTSQPCCAHLPPCPGTSARGVLALVMVTAWLGPKHPLLSHHPPMAWLWSGSHHLP